MEWLQAQGNSLGVFRRKKGNKLCADVRFCEGHLRTTRIQSETEGKFYYDIAKILERMFRGGAGSSKGNCNYLNFLEDSVSIPLECILPKNFQISNSRMRLKLMSDILKLARDAAQKFEQSQAIRSHMDHAQASHLQASLAGEIHPQTKLSEQAIQSVDACFATVEKSLGRQRVDEDGRPLKLHDEPDSSSHHEGRLQKTDEGIGLCCPVDKIDDSSEAWLSNCWDYGQSCRGPLMS